MKKRLPKFNYYDEFIKNVSIALEMSEILKEFINNFEEWKKVLLGLILSDVMGLLFVFIITKLIEKI